MPLSFKKHIENLFKNNTKFSDSDGNMDINSILESIDKIDIELIKILKNDEKAKEKFFVKVDGIYILEQNKLIEFFTQNDYMRNGSYTSYTNKIGLIKKDSFIKKFDDVVLAWPHKDCILEGGQTKDDDKNKEVFYNEILSSDEIDRLFEPKVLTNIKRYSKNGIEENSTIKDDDNLIIKGNNLIALHSLKKKYAGQVKIIYIDPPYNTGKDSFNYNDNFNHSTWLTFMKNRLEVAKEFLSDDGLIFVQCDDNEQAYLKVLMDEIFNKDNFLANLVWENKEGGGKSDSKYFRIKHEYILVYGKKKEQVRINGLDVENIDRYKLSDKFEETRGKYYLQKLGMGTIQYSKSLDYEIEAPDGTFILPKDNNKGQRACWRWGKEKLEWGLKNDFVVIKKDSTGIWTVYTKQYLNCDNEGNIKKRTLQPIGVIAKYSTTQSNKHLKELFEKAVFNYSKPEAYIKFILDISTQPNDLIMDYHLGSSTTCAVAHKIGRRYIGIEQMDYIESISVERLKKVIDGEQGGISKVVDWQGGGDFIYAELKEIDIFKDSEIGKLNKTMQYLPISEIEDEEYQISKEEIAINKVFYGIENE